MLFSMVVVLCVAACNGGSGGSKKLALGTEAVVAYTTTASGSTPAANTTLGVTVLKVRSGTQEELTSAGFKVEDQDKDATPYYVDVRYANKGSGAVPRELSVGLEDKNDNSVPTLLVTSLTSEPFDLCKDASSTSPLNPGESYESCTLFLVPKGMTLDRARFVSQSADATITFTDWAVS
jgi:hypothetical protein